MQPEQACGGSGAQAYSGKAISIAHHFQFCKKAIGKITIQKSKKWPA